MVEIKKNELSKVDNALENLRSFPGLNFKFLETLFS